MTLTDETRASDAEARIAALTLPIEKLGHEFYGWRSQRKARRLEQLELELDGMTPIAAEDKIAAEQAAAESVKVKPPVRRKPGRKPFPAHLPRALDADQHGNILTLQELEGSGPDAEQRRFGVRRTFSRFQGVSNSAMRASRNFMKSLSSRLGDATQWPQADS